MPLAFIYFNMRYIVYIYNVLYIQRKKNVFRKPILIPTTIVLLYTFSYDTTTYGSCRTYTFTYSDVLCENIFRDGFAVDKIAFPDAISFTHEIVFLLRISFLITSNAPIFAFRPHDFSNGKNWSENRWKFKIIPSGNCYCENNKHCNVTSTQCSTKTTEI